MNFFPPEYFKQSFHCTSCGVLAAQNWTQYIDGNYLEKKPNGSVISNTFRMAHYQTARCSHCLEFSIWFKNKMVHPIAGSVELANPDLPEEITTDYNEAKGIVNISPRGAAALLRLAVQKLCIHLGEKGKNINDDIKSLVKKGLPATMQQALDSVRVIGNNAVHPGTIDFGDNIDIAYALFGFVNLICETLISQPKKIKEYYEKHIPEEDRIKIENRDN